MIANETEHEEHDEDDEHDHDHDRAPKGLFFIFIALTAGRKLTSST